MKALSRLVTTLAATAAFCAATLAFSHDANAVPITANNFLGFVDDGTGGDAERTAYVNHMIGMNFLTVDSFMGQTFQRSGDDFGPLPTAVFDHNGTSTTLDLGTGGLYTYLFVAYAIPGSQVPALSFVYYVGNLSGSIDLLLEYRGLNFLDWTLFTAGGQGVPDSGTTVSLLGCAFIGLAALRRKLGC